jgi:hypothetical protein
VRSHPGSWFDNNIAIVEVGEDALDLSWVTGVVEGDVDRPRLRTVYAARIEPLTGSVGVGSGFVQGSTNSRNTEGVA